VAVEFASSALTGRIDAYAPAMAKLLYASNMSLDGFTEDADGALDWAPPDDDVFVFITELMRSAATYLYGRLMFEALAVWETDPSLAEGSELRAEYARVWCAANKVVYSRTLDSVPTTKTRLERDFDPGAVREMKATAPHDLLVGGPHLAAEAFRAGLVDECHLIVWPVILGGQNPALPSDQRVDLELLDERRFDNGVVHLHYRVLP
jgi:dihydrofolate reductase